MTMGSDVVAANAVAEGAADKSALNPPELVFYDVVRDAIPPEHSKTS